jgi:hypothetical membrane protein
MKDFCYYILAALALFFAPIKGLVIAVGIAIIIDTITGVLKSIKLVGWHSITSRRLSDIISKIFLYNVCLIGLFVIDVYVLDEFFVKWFGTTYFATKMCAILLVFIESVSVKENFEAALKINIWQLMKTALKRAKEIKHDIDEI